MQHTWLGVWSILAASVGAALLGCGTAEDGPPTFPVTGTVTQGGTPVAGAAVAFIPEGNGPSAIGVTDSAGKYQLTTRKAGDGAVAGRYKVTVAKYQGGSTGVTDMSQVKPDLDNINDYPPDYREDAPPAEASKNLLPDRYSDPNRSGLTADVKAGPNTHNFEIEE